MLEHFVISIVIIVAVELLCCSPYNNRILGCENMCTVSANAVNSHLSSGISITFFDLHNIFLSTVRMDVDAVSSTADNSLLY
jgi:hypothetical protein